MFDPSFPSSFRSPHSSLAWLVILLLLAGGLAGCISSGTSAGTTSSEAPSGPNASSPTPSPRASALANAETFDAARYPVRRSTRSASIQHDVPPRLMRLRADRGVTETVEGFRVQVYSATNKQSAEEFRANVQSWLASAMGEAPTGLFSRNEAPVVIQYSQPYYRVRVGAFTQRDQARDALEFVRTRYEDAFIARSTVTVTR